MRAIVRLATLAASAAIAGVAITACGSSPGAPASR